MVFDSVPHQRLITKLNMHGISGTILNLIRNFLSERQQMVKVGNIFSKTSDVTSGEPQGSSKCEIFADDAKLYNFSLKCFAKIYKFTSTLV